MALDPALKAEMERAGIFATTYGELLSWGRKNSIWPLQFGLACCAIEMIAAAASRWDIARFGSEVFRASPRQADLMIVAGTVTKKMVPNIVRLWNQMGEPKYCIAMGVCAIAGGPFKQGYNVLKGIDRFVPVDVHIPGCPPRPEALIHALMTLQQKIDAREAGQGANPNTPAEVRAVEYPIPELGAHDVIPPYNPMTWKPPKDPRADLVKLKSASATKDG